MLNKYGEFWYAICTLRSNLLSVALELKHRKSKTQNIAKEALKSKNIEIGSQIVQQG